MGLRLPLLRFLWARKGESWGTLLRLLLRSLFAEGPRATWRRMRSYARTVESAAEAPLPPRDGRCFALLVAGCPGHPRRWRCEHAQEQLRLAGRDADILDHPAADLAGYLDRYEVFVLQRVPADPSVLRFLELARERGRKVIADVDDLVVDEGCVELLPFAPAMTPLGRELYGQQLRRIGEVLQRLEACLVPTTTLRRELQQRHPHLRVQVVRNVASAAMVERSTLALAAQPAGDGVVFGYFSGTPTHQQDLQSITGALAGLLRQRPSARLLLAGEIEVPAALAAFGSQVERCPGVPWVELPALLRRAHVHLVPLLPGSVFNAAKSELKWVEAGLVGRPVLASALGPYRECVRDGENGVLAADSPAWLPALLRLCDDAAWREGLGAAARADVLERWTVTAAWPELAAVLA